MAKNMGVQSKIEQNTSDAGNAELDTLEEARRLINEKKSKVPTLENGLSAAVAKRRKLEQKKQINTAPLAVVKQSIFEQIKQLSQADSPRSNSNIQFTSRIREQINSCDSVIAIQAYLENMDKQQNLNEEQVKLSQLYASGCLRNYELLQEIKYEKFTKNPVVDAKNSLLNQIRQFCTTKYNKSPSNFEFTQAVWRDISACKSITEIQAYLENMNENPPLDAEQARLSKLYASACLSNAGFLQASKYENPYHKKESLSQAKKTTVDDNLTILDASDKLYNLKSTLITSIHKYVSNRIEKDYSVRNILGFRLGDEKLTLRKWSIAEQLICDIETSTTATEIQKFLQAASDENERIDPAVSHAISKSHLAVLLSDGLKSEELTTELSKEASITMKKEVKAIVEEHGLTNHEVNEESNDFSS